MNTSIGGFLTFLVLFTFAMGVVISLKFRKPTAAPPTKTEYFHSEQENYRRLLSEEKMKRAIAEGQLEAFSKRIVALNAEILEGKRLVEKAEKKNSRLENQLKISADSIIALNQAIADSVELLEQVKTEKKILQDSIVTMSIQLTNLQNDYADLYKKHERTKSLFKGLLTRAGPLLGISILGILFLVYRKRTREVFV